MNLSRVLCVFLLVSLTVACDRQPSLSQPASDLRLVVLGGELSETVVALGFEHNLVAVDTTSVWPARLQSLPSVGYLRQLNTEGVLALKPTLILASHEAGPPEVLEQWRKLGIKVHQIETGPEIATATTAIREVGKLLDESEKAAELVADIKGDLARLRSLPQPPRILFLLSKTGNQVLVAGTDTKAHTVITAAGGHNLGAAFSGYKPMTPEAIVKLAPDFVLLPSHSLQSFGGRDQLLNEPAIRMTPAGRHDRVVVMDSQVLLSLGPRLGEGVRELNRHFSSLSSDAVKTASRTP